VSRRSFKEDKEDGKTRSNPKLFLEKWLPKAYLLKEMNLKVMLIIWIKKHLAGALISEC
jgi:hypothetical protein